MTYKKATLNLDPELHWKLKSEAVKRRMKLGELAELLLKEGLKKFENLKSRTG